MSYLKPHSTEPNTEDSPDVLRELFYYRESIIKFADRDEVNEFETESSWVAMSSVYDVPLRISKKCIWVGEILNEVREAYYGNLDIGPTTLAGKIADNNCEYSPELLGESA
ncbi:MAG: hypothetical protein RLN62_06265 [Rickettsiales bacterium]